MPGGFAAVDGAAGEVDEGECAVERLGPVAVGGEGVPVDVLGLS